MMMQIKKITILLAVLIAFSNTSNLYGQAFKDIPKAFRPNDLTKNNHILLIKVPHTNKRDINVLNEFFGEYYSGRFQVVKFSEPIDATYPDTAIYKYVLVIGSAIKEKDFNGISNKELFFDKATGYFIVSGSSLYIFDRTS